MDMIGLADRLPEVTEGANKWITAVEENTGGKRVALGDMKALLMHVAGKQVTEDIFIVAKPRVVTGNTVDDVAMGPHRNDIWTAVQEHFPERMEHSKLEGEQLKNNEVAFQHKWKDETGSV